MAKSEEEFLEYFRVIDIDSKKPEENVVKDKCDGNGTLFIKARNIPDVLSIITNLSSKNIEVPKMPKWRH